MNISRNIYILGLLVFASLNFASLCFQLYFGGKAEFTSDTSGYNLFAESIWQGSSFFPEGWKYNNRDIWYASSLLVILPLVKFFGIGYPIYAIGNCIYILICLIIGYFYINKLISNRILSFMLINMLMTGISYPLLSRLLFDWAAQYGTYTLIGLIVWVELHALAKSITTESDIIITFRSLSILFMTIGLLTLSNPLRATLYVIVPMIVYFVIYAYSRRNLVNNLRALISISVLTSTVVCGFILNFEHTKETTILTVPSMLSVEELPAHINIFLRSWLFLFGYPSNFYDAYQIKDGIKATEWLGIAMTIKAWFSIISLALPIFFIQKSIQYFKINKHQILFPTVALIIGVTLQLFFFRYPVDNEYYSIRYIVPQILLCLLAILVIYRNFLINFLSSKVLIFIIFIILFNSFFNNIYPVRKWYTQKELSLGVTNDQLISNCLVDHGLKHGLGGYWSSNVYTVLSKGAVRILPTTISSNNIEIYPILQNRRWYLELSKQEKIFIIFTKDEYTNLDKDEFYRQTGRPYQTLECGKMKVEIFSSEVMKAMVRNFQLSIVGQNKINLLVGVDTFTSAQQNDTKSGFKKGFISYGPYLEIRPGKYRATANLNVSSLCEAEDCGFLDVVSSAGVVVLAKSAVRTSGEYNLFFETKKPIDDLEFRIYSTGKSAISIDEPLAIEWIGN
jgi:hypothetical protein